MAKLILSLENSVIREVPLDKFASLVKLSPAAVEYIAEHEGEHAAQQLPGEAVVVDDEDPQPGELGLHRVGAPGYAARRRR